MPSYIALSYFSVTREIPQDNYVHGQQYKHGILAYHNYGLCLLIYGSPSKAEALLQKAVIDYPSKAEFWGYLALAKALVHKKNEAITAITKAYQLDPSDPKIASAYYNLLHNQPVSLSTDGKKFIYNSELVQFQKPFSNVYSSCRYMMTQ